MKKRIRVLHIINELEMGGAPRLVTDIVVRMSKMEDLEIGLLTFGLKKDDHLHNLIISNPAISYHELRSRRPFSPVFLRELNAVSKNYDIIHAHLFPSGYIAALSNFRNKKPIIFTEHSTHNRRRDISLLRPLERMIYSRYSTIAAISPQVAEKLDSWLKSNKLTPKILTINNGVNLSRFASSPEVSSKDLFGREGRAIIMISRFTGAKDHETLIKSVPLLDDKEMFLALVGDGPTLGACKELAHHYGVSDRCLFLGSRNDIPALIHASWIGVQSSHWEGFGLTAIEIMACGKPIIASNVPGLGNIVEGAGLLFPKGNAEALARNINLLAKSPEEYKTLVKMGKARAHEYDIANTVEKYVKLYKENLEGKAKS